MSRQYKSLGPFRIPPFDAPTNKNLHIPQTVEQ